MAPAGRVNGPAMTGRALKNGESETAPRPAAFKNSRRPTAPQQLGDEQGGCFSGSLMLFFSFLIYSDSTRAKTVAGLSLRF
jgi:hypothetical protein